jgi:PAS domain S-box-containing protein
VNPRELGRNADVKTTLQADVNDTPQAFDTMARLAIVVESSRDAIIGKTLGGVITSWNAGAEQMYGYRADEIIGHNISVLIPSDRSSELEPIIARVARGEAVQTFETQRVAKDGSILDMSVTISPIRDVHGTVTGAYTVARDHTELTRAKAYQHWLETQLNQLRRSTSMGHAGVQDTDTSDLSALLQPVSTQPDLGSELTPREVEVLVLMARGLLNKQVARHLGLQLNTVRNHSQSILGKLHAHSRLEAVTTAVRDGIIDYPTHAVAI